MSVIQRTGASPVRAALNQANAAAERAEAAEQRARNERVMTKSEDVPGRVLFWRILLAPYVAQYDGRIIQPEIIERAEKVACSVGRVLQIGHFAFRSKTAAGLDLSEEPNRPKVGDYVLHQLYAGQTIKLRGDKELRIIDETEILMVLDDPEQIRGYL